MKKTYKMPNTQVVEVELQQVIAGSPLTVNGSGDVTGGELQNGDAESAALSRQNVWDD
jgi:hypothetical protein